MLILCGYIIRVLLSHLVNYDSEHGWTLCGYIDLLQLFLPKEQASKVALSAASENLLQKNAKPNLGSISRSYSRINLHALDSLGGG